MSWTSVVRITAVGLALQLAGFAPGPVETRAFAASVPAFSPSTLPDVPWHLTARPWRPSYVDLAEFLDVGESIARADVRHQAASGAILDAYSGREQQYQTPYFAASVAILVANGRATDLLPNGIAAMERATWELAGGRSRIADNHGEFFIAPLAEALPLYKPYISTTRYETWRTRLGTPIENIVSTGTQNWRTYAMKGEWLRAKNGYVDKPKAVSWIESSWTGSQRSRLTVNYWNQYSDRSTLPDTHVYDAAARSNLFAMLQEGYDGASRGDIDTLLQRGAKTSLLMQDPSGMNPAGGRSGDHVWNDVYSGNVFAEMSEDQRTRNARLASQYRHAALMNLQSIRRWRRSDGTYSVTKNQFDPASRVGYATYSWFQNYNGNVMFHSLESYALMKSHVAEQPAPSEIGGFGFATDPSIFSSAFANAGGMLVQAATRGQTTSEAGQYWTTLGVSRFGRVGWDSRLGPSNGVRNPSGQAISFAPTFLENGSWVRLANVPDRYEGFVSYSFVHPLLVRWAIDYRPRSGRTGPTFRNEFVVTPDGVLSTITSSSSSFGTTIPVVENDGRALAVSYGGRIARMSYPGLTDQQNFIAVQPGAAFDTSGNLVRGAIGDVRPVRMTVTGSTTNQVFVYPRDAGDPSAEQVQSSFVRTGNDFSTDLGSVKGTLYVGRTSAGGFGSAIDLDGNGTADVNFGAPCNFVLQLYRGQVSAVETDRAVTGTVQGRSVSLAPYTPLSFAADLSVSVSASGAEVGNPAVNVRDGSLGTRWSAAGLGQWLKLDLGSVRGISELKLGWYQGNSRTARFDIEGSSDGITWDTVVAGVSSSGTTTALESYPLGAVTARYLRITNRGNSLGSPWIAITEARVSGR